MTVTLHVCITCRAGEPANDAALPLGGQLHQALDALDLPANVRIVPVECLSACGNGAAVALSGPGRWSYVYGRMSETDAPDILQGAADYAATSDGIVPWRQRITIFRKRSLARIPPIG